MTAQTTPRHRVPSAVAQMREIADDLVDVPVWSMSSREASATLLEVVRLKAQVAELEARIAGHADAVGVGSEAGAASTARWLAHATRAGAPAAHRVIAFAHALETRELVRDALAHGTLLADQAAVIVRALDRLPAELAASVVREAEAHLVRQAREHDPRALRVLGKRLLDVVAPDVADAHEARLLEREDAEAARSTSLRMVDDGHGRTHGRFTVPTAVGAQLRKMLLALSAPKHLTAAEGASVIRRPSPERWGRAFCELVSRYPADRIPQAGGVAATVVVTIDHRTLTGAIERAGVLDTGETISPSTARRLACEAAIVPAVLGGRSEVLDLGRARRLFSRAQRLWLAMKYGGCAAEGCDWPPGLCHAHHLTAWQHGGRSDIANGVLLCPHHHARAHDSAYELRRTARAVSFHRRT